MVHNGNGDNMYIVMIRTVFFYFFIFLIYRIMGKRELGQLSIIDLIVSLLIAELTIISIENYKESILYSLVPIVILVLLQCILSYIGLKKPKFRIFLDGNPSVIIKNGKINYNEMLKQRYNLDDLLVQLRDKGYRSIEEVEYAILESSGTLSIFPYENGKSPLPLPIILDGNIQEDTIKHLKKDKKWVYNFLDKKNINIEDVFFAFYKDKNIFITVDLDVLDTSIMPGTGTPEVGGLDFNQLVGWFKYLSQFNIIGADVVELAPDYDASGASTAVATKVIRELLMAVS